MKGPSKKWKSIRRAVLERAQRSAIRPLETLFTIHAAVCVYYVVGCLCLKYFDYTANFTLIEAAQVLTVAISGFLVPVLTGSVVTLHLTSRRLKEMANDWP